MRKEVREEEKGESKIERKGGRERETVGENE